MDKLLNISRKGRKENAEDTKPLRNSPFSPPLR